MDLIVGQKGTLWGFGVVVFWFCFGFLLVCARMLSRHTHITHTHEHKDAHTHTDLAETGVLSVRFPKTVSYTHLTLPTSSYV